MKRKTWNLRRRRNRQFCNEKKYQDNNFIDGLERNWSKLKQEIFQEENRICSTKNITKELEVFGIEEGICFFSQK